MVEKFRLYPDGTVVHEDEFRECDERYDDFGTYTVDTEMCLNKQPFLPEELISALREEFEYPSNIAPFLVLTDSEEQPIKTK